MQNEKELNKYSDPKKREFWKSAILAVEKKTGCTIIVTDTERTYKEQAALHAANPKNAKPGTSKHESGNAIDINVITPAGKQVRKADKDEVWLATGVPQAFKSIGLKWGGDFQNYHDPVHFEIPSGYVQQAIDAVKKISSGSGSFLLIIALLLLLTFTFLVI